MAAREKDKSNHGLTRIITDNTMVESEREILRERSEEAKLGERTPFDSSRQATYEDSVVPESDWECEDS